MSPSVITQECCWGRKEKLFRQQQKHCRARSKTLYRYTPRNVSTFVFVLCLSCGVAKEGEQSPVEVLFSLPTHIVYLGNTCIYSNKKDPQVLEVSEPFAKIISTHSWRRQETIPRPQRFPFQASGYVQRLLLKFCPLMLISTYLVAWIFRLWVCWKSD